MVVLFTCRTGNRGPVTGLCCHLIAQGRGRRTRTHHGARLGLGRGSSAAPERGAADAAGALGSEGLHMTQHQRDRTQSFVQSPVTGCG